MLDELLPPMTTKEKVIMNITQRMSLAVYLYYNRDVRKLTKWGDIFYHSRRLKYVILYIDGDRQEEITAHLTKMNAVKKVIPSQLDKIDMDFVGNHDGHNQG